MPCSLSARYRSFVSCGRKTPFSTLPPQRPSGETHSSTRSFSSPSWSSSASLTTALASCSVNPLSSPGIHAYQTLSGNVRSSASRKETKRARKSRYSSLCHTCSRLSPAARRAFMDSYSRCSTVPISAAEMPMPSSCFFASWMPQRKALSGAEAKRRCSIWYVISALEMSWVMVVLSKSNTA